MPLPILPGCCWRYVVYYCAKTPNIMSKRDIDDLLFWATLGVILGGRTGYILFYNLEYYMANPANILKVWQGGMAFHGGFMGVIVANRATQASFTKLRLKV